MMTNFSDKKIRNFIKMGYEQESGQEVPVRYIDALFAFCVLLFICSQHEKASKEYGSQVRSADGVIQFSHRLSMGRNMFYKDMKGFSMYIQLERVCGGRYITIGSDLHEV